ncbi:hypothetical protein BDV95DRAFT_347060 [Massariosphaeria phaeospora]|uniref:GPI anchored protein n=1 Tax=Massariosphaeria phaeospora TaxID=100035 RepID=A0A7C8ICB9_9PLEO|nr:hypothetical protein BDV95DRAFT_347060 [Massariosphaeria phaeospora]
MKSQALLLTLGVAAVAFAQSSVEDLGPVFNPTEALDYFSTSIFYSSRSTTVIASPRVPTSTSRASISSTASSSTISPSSLRPTSRTPTPTPTPTSTATPSDATSTGSAPSEQSSGAAQIMGYPSVVGAIAGGLAAGLALI